MMDEFAVIMVHDVDFPLLVIGAAWIAILSMLAWGVLAELGRLVRRPPRAPFFGMLERHGISLVQAEEVAGFAALRDAAARCASCDAAEGCRRALRWPWLGLAAPRCPNRTFFARVAGQRFS